MEYACRSRTSWDRPPAEHEMVEHEHLTKPLLSRQSGTSQQQLKKRMTTGFGTQRAFRFHIFTIRWLRLKSPTDEKNRSSVIARRFAACKKTSASHDAIELAAQIATQSCLEAWLPSPSCQARQPLTAQEAVTRPKPFTHSIPMQRLHVFYALLLQVWAGLRG